MYMNHVFPLASSSNRAQHSAGLYLKSRYFVLPGFFFFWHSFWLLRKLLHENTIYLDDWVFGTHLILHSKSVPHFPCPTPRPALNHSYLTRVCQGHAALGGSGRGRVCIPLFVVFHSLPTDVLITHFIPLPLLIALLTIMATSPLPSSCCKLFYMIL